MRIFLQKKLSRDKTIELLEANGSRCEYRFLDDAEYDLELRRKLFEESAEVAGAQNNTELMAELADVLEVIDALSAAHALDRGELEAMQQKKRESRGGFYKRVYVECAHHPVGSFGEAYCLADPKKYPEVIE